jgi:hypothetical protein
MVCVSFKLSLSLPLLLEETHTIRASKQEDVAAETNAERHTMRASIYAPSLRSFLQQRLSMPLLCVRFCSWSCLRTQLRATKRRWAAPHAALRVLATLTHAGACACLHVLAGQEYFADLHCLDVTRWHWWKPQTSGARPPPRSSHSMTILGHKAFIFGGVGSDVGLTQSSTLPTTFVELDLSTWTWTHPHVDGLPHQRFVHRVAAFGSRMLLFGGRTMRLENGKFNDLHWFDSCTMSWEKVEGVRGDIPVERGGFTFVPVGSKVIAFCGRAQDDICLMDGVYILHTAETPMRWQKVDVQGLHGPRDVPSPRGAHGFGYMNGKIVVFGGYGPPKGRGRGGGGGGGDGEPLLHVPEQPLDDLYFLGLRSPLNPNP